MSPVLVADVPGGAGGSRPGGLVPVLARADAPGGIEWLTAQRAVGPTGRHHLHRASGEGARGIGGEVYTQHVAALGGVLGEDLDFLLLAAFGLGLLLDLLGFDDDPRGFGVPSQREGTHPEVLLDG